MLGWVEGEDGGPTERERERERDKGWWWECFTVGLGSSHREDQRVS